MSYKRYFIYWVVLLAGYDGVAIFSQGHRSSLARVLPASQAKAKNSRLARDRSRKNLLVKQWKAATLMGGAMALLTWGVMRHWPTKAATRDANEEVNEPVPLPNKDVKLQFVDESWFAGKTAMQFDQSADANVRGVIVPHAGLTYSGKTIADMFSLVNWEIYDRIVILSTLHQTGNNWQLPSQVKTINTPTGNGRLAIDHIPGLSFEENIEAFEQEHSWQVLLPYIDDINTYRTSIGKNALTIVPLLIGKEEGIEAIQRYLQYYPTTLLVANTDLRHTDLEATQTTDALRAFDKDTIKQIEDAVTSGAAPPPSRDNEDTMCGHYAVHTFARLAAQESFTLYQQKVSDSLLEVPEPVDRTRTYVGYVGMAFTSDYFLHARLAANPAFIEELRALPAKVLRDNQSLLSQRGGTHDFDAIASRYKILHAPIIHGIFVTIKNKDTLRGCIGEFEAKGWDIGYGIARQTLESAFSDSRFTEKPIEAEELDSLSFEVTILGPLTTIYKKNNSLDPSVAFQRYYKEGFGVRIRFAGGIGATYLASVIEQMEYHTIIEELYQKGGGDLEKPSDVEQMDIYRCDIV